MKTFRVPDPPIVNPPDPNPPKPGSPKRPGND